MENRNLAIVLEFHYSEKRYKILDAAADILSLGEKIVYFDCLQRTQKSFD